MTQNKLKGTGRIPFHLIRCLITSISLSCLLSSCWNTDNYGYPSKITFGKEGGSKICSGTSSCYTVEIYNYNGDGESASIDVVKGENDSVIVTYQWLTVTYKPSTGPQLKITAQPNHKGKERKLYVSGMVDDSFAEIKVVQH